MSRQNFTEGQEIVTQDLNAISQGLEETLLDNVIWPLIAAAAGFFGNGFYVTYDSSTGVTVSEGWGIQRDANQTDPEPMTRILVNDDDSTIYAIETPDATNDRIDIVQVKWEIANGATGTREFKAAGGSVGDATAQLRKDWSADIQIKTGTPAGSPSAPTVDTGYVKIAELYVTASTGIANQAAITDTRTIAKLDYSLFGGVNSEQQTAHTLTANSPEDIIIDSPSGVVNQDLPTTNVRAGKRFTLRASGMDSSNYVVLRSSDGDTVHSFDHCANGGAGYVKVLALRDNPTDSTHWLVIEKESKVTVSTASSGDFAADSADIIFVRHNDFVLAYADGPIKNTVSASSPESASGLIPSFFRPSGDFRDTYLYDGSTRQTVRIYSSGTFGMLYEGNRTSSTFNPNFQYVIF